MGAIIHPRLSGVFGSPLALVESEFPPEADALFAAMTTQPSAERKKVAAAFYTTAKSRSYWNKLSFFYVLRAHDKQASKLNWLNPAKFVLAESGALTFMADRGWAGDGTSARLLTGIEVGSADSKMTTTSSSLLVWCVSDFQSDASVIGYRQTSTGGGSLIIPRSTTNLFIGRCNSAASATATVPGAAGLSAVSRTGATTTKTYRNGVLMTTGAGAVTAFPAGVQLAICGTTGTQSGSSTHELAFAAGGEGLTDQEMADIYNDVAALMQGMIDTVTFANFGDSHAGLGLMNYVGTAVGRTLTQVGASAGGETLAQTLGRADVVIAANPLASHYVVQTGTNSWRAGTTAEQMQTEFASLVTKLRSAGKVVWLLTVPPSGNMQQQPPLTNRKVRALLAVNDWLRANYANVKGVKLVDTWPVVAEPIVTPADNDDPWYRAGFSLGAAPMTSKGTGYGPNTYAQVTHNGGEGGAYRVNLLNGTVDSLTPIARGFNYTPATRPTIAIIDPDGSGSGAVVGTVALLGSIGDYTIQNGGSGVADGAAISAPQGGALQHEATVVATGGVVTDTIVTRLGFGYSSQANASVSSGAGVAITPIMVSPYMWKTQMVTGDTHEVAAGLLAEAALLVPLLAAA